MKGFYIAYTQEAVDAIIFSSWPFWLCNNTFHSSFSNDIGLWQILNTSPDRSCISFNRHKYVDIMVCQQLTILVLFNTHFRTRQSHEPCGCKKVKLQLRCTVANLRVQYELQFFIYYSTRSACFVCKYSPFHFLQYNFTNSLSWWPQGLRLLACWDWVDWIPPGTWM